MSLLKMIRGASVWSAGTAAPPFDSASIPSERSSSPMPLSSSSSSTSSPVTSSLSEHNNERSRRLSDFVPSRTANDRRSEYSQSRSPSSASLSARSNSSADDAHRIDSDDDESAAESSAVDSDGEFVFESESPRSISSATLNSVSSSPSPSASSSSASIPPSPLVASTPPPLVDGAATIAPSAAEIVRCERILQSGHVFTLNALATPPSVKSRKIVVFLVDRCLYGCEYRAGQYKYRQPIVALPLERVSKMTVFLGNATPALALANGTHEAAFALRVRSSAPAKLLAFSRSPLIDDTDGDADDFMLELSAPSVGDMKYWLRTLHTVLAHSFGLTVNATLFYQQNVSAEAADVDRAVKRIRFGRTDAARSRNFEERAARIDAEARMKRDRRLENEPVSIGGNNTSSHTRIRALTVETGNKSAVNAAAPICRDDGGPLLRTSLFPNSLQLNLERAIRASHSTPILLNMR